MNELATLKAKHESSQTVEFRPLFWASNNHSYLQPLQLFCSTARQVIKFSEECKADMQLFFPNVNRL